MSSGLYLVAGVGGTTIALPAETVEAVVRITALVPVPCAPPTIIGLATLRSRVFTLLDTALLPHGLGWTDGTVQMASLDHAMWFHREFRADQWLLYDQSSFSTSHARGLAGGAIFTQEGELVVTVVQEGLLRGGL